MKILREKTPEFWEQAWQEAHKYSLHARKRRELDQLDYWNSMAKFFANTAKKKAGKKRPQKVLSWLEQEGAWKPGSNVLDIGAGAGNFTIPMAKKAAHITALEPAPAMLSVLQKTFVMKGLVMYSIWTRNGRLLIHSRWVSLLVLILSSLHSPLASEMWRH